MPTILTRRQRNEAIGFEDRPLATELMLALWTGILAGGVVAAGGFDDPRPLHNGAVRLIALGATAVLLGWALKATSRRVAWRLQFGVFASLLLHSLGFAALSQAELSAGSAAGSQLAEAPLREMVKPPRELRITPPTQPLAEQRTPAPFETPVASAALTPPELAFEPLPRASTAPPEAPQVTPPKLAAREVAPQVEGQAPKSPELLAATAELPLAPAPPSKGEPQLTPQALPPLARSVPQLAMTTPSLAPRTTTTQSAQRRPTIELSLSPTTERLLPLRPQALPSESQTTAANATQTQPSPLTASLPPLPRSAPAGIPTAKRISPTPGGTSNPGIVRNVTPELSASDVVEPLRPQLAAAPPMAIDTPADSARVSSTPINNQIGSPALAPLPRSVGSTLEPVTRTAMASPTSGRPGMAPSLSASAAEAPQRMAAAFDRKSRRNVEGEGAGDRAQLAKTESAVEAGLAYLAPLQLADGRWSFRQLGREVDADELPSAQADGAATGLVLLAMLGAGYDHLGDKYQRPIQRGLQFLVAQQEPSGLLFPEEGQSDAWGVARFYSHGIATIALCETYGMTGDPDLREPAQQALDYIAAAQVEDLGGWRYTAGVNSDLSVSGWQLMALRSGELAGLKVSPVTYRNVRSFVEQCREAAGDRARFCYNPTAPADDPRMSHGRLPGTVMTSVGLLAQLYLGEDRNDRQLQRGADHLLAHLPTPGEVGETARISTLGNPLRDTYYWYYATQVMFHMRGDYWRAWNDSLHPLLVDSQARSGPLAGSWDPLRPTPDRWAGVGGRLYVTTMNLLSLEVYYRHLPLYETVGK
jgi:hypothetical protein